MVGVVRDVPITRRLSFADVWVPISTAKSTATRMLCMGGFQGIVLARSRADFREIKSEFARRLGAIEPPDPEQYKTVSSGAYTQFEQLARELLGTSSDEEEIAEAPVGRLTRMIVLIAFAFMLLPALNLVNLCTQPHPRTLLGDRRAQGVRRVVAARSSASSSSRTSS